MRQSAYSKEELENVMRRLRGPAQSSADTEKEDLKKIVKTLGYKLKEAYQQLSLQQQEEKKEDQKGLWCHIEQLKEQLDRKQEEIDLLSHTKTKMQLTCDMLHQEIEALKSRTLSREQMSELADLREEKILLAQTIQQMEREKEQLQRELSQRPQENTVVAQSEMIKLTVACQQFKDEISSLASERNALLQQVQQMKNSQNSEYQSLQQEYQSLQEDKERWKQEREQLEVDATKHQHMIRLMEQEKKGIEDRESVAQRQLLFFQEMLAEEKERSSVMERSLQPLQDRVRILEEQLGIAEKKSSEHESQFQLLVEEKETAVSQLREIEEHMITKLQQATELEEELETSVRRVELLESELKELQKEKEIVDGSLATKEEEHQALQQKTTQLESKFSTALGEVVGLRKRLEAFERLKRTEREAYAHAQAICRLLDGGPKIPYISVQGLAEGVPVQESMAMPKDQLEQHELF